MTMVLDLTQVVQDLLDLNQRLRVENAELRDRTRWLEGKNRAGRRDKRNDVHDPEAWRELTDGRWLSPSGRTYRADTKVVRAVRAQRGRSA